MEEISIRYNIVAIFTRLHKKDDLNLKNKDYFNYLYDISGKILTNCL